jgi:peptide/nickel transport system substrate-binding protein
MRGRGVLAAVSLLALTTGLASAAPAKQGGILRIGTTGASTQVDPQIAYVATAWSLEYATAAKLYNYPDKPGQAGGFLRPEVASRVRVSGTGMTYTFTIRKGFRFSDGSPVTARNFAYAIKRAKSSALDAPAAAYASDIASATAKGSRLVIQLKRLLPALLTTLAMPFFQATSTKLPLTKEVTTGFPSAGPYYLSRNDVNVLTSIRKNPYWHGDRPRHLDGVDIQWNLNEQTAYEQTLANQLDEGPVPASQREALAQQFSVNKTRFWKQPINCMSFVLFNNSKGLFAGNPSMRKAVNWALDRTDYLAGSFQTPWTHLLGPLEPGSITAKSKQPYSVHANIAKARALAAGHFRDGRITVWYRSSGSVNPAQAQIVKRDLLRLGFSPDNLEMKGFSGAQIYDALGVAGADYDLALSVGWCADYPDAFGSLRAALYSTGVRDPSIDRQLAALANLPTKQRVKAYGKLDIEIMKKAAPLAPMGFYNNVFLFSDRVDPRSLLYQPVYADFSIPALRLK